MADMRRAAPALIALVTVLMAGPLPAAEPLFDTPAERAALGRELRALLQDEPGIVAKALTGPAPVDPYAEEKAADLATIGAEAARLFAPGAPGIGAPEAGTVWAVFLRPGCEGCAEVLADLQGLVADRDLRVSVFLLPDGPEDARPALLRALAARGDGSDAAALQAFVAAPDRPGAEVLAALDLEVTEPDAASARADAEMFARLGFDMAPSYVLPDMMIRGHMPAFVLERYLDR